MLPTSFLSTHTLRSKLRKMICESRCWSFYFSDAFCFHNRLIFYWFPRWNSQSTNKCNVCSYNREWMTFRCVGQPQIFSLIWWSTTPPWYESLLCRNLSRMMMWVYDHSQMRLTGGYTQVLGYRWLFIGLPGHPPNQPDHRAYDLWYRPRARWCGAADGPTTDSGGPWEHAGYCKCEFVHYSETRRLIRALHWHFPNKHMCS